MRDYINILEKIIQGLLGLKSIIHSKKVYYAHKIITLDYMKEINNNSRFIIRDIKSGLYNGHWALEFGILVLYIDKLLTYIDRFIKLVVKEQDYEFIREWNMFQENIQMLKVEIEVYLGSNNTLEQIDD